jgi:hypothetical protein
MAADKIVLQGSKTSIVDDSGNDLAVFTSSGINASTITTGTLDTDTVIADSSFTGTYITQSDFGYIKTTAESEIFIKLTFINDTLKAVLTSSEFRAFLTLYRLEASTGSAVITTIGTASLFEGTYSSTTTYIMYDNTYVFGFVDSSPVTYSTTKYYYTFSDTFQHNYNTTDTSVEGFLEFLVHYK